MLLQSSKILFVQSKWEIILVLTIMNFLLLLPLNFYNFFCILSFLYFSLIYRDSISCFPFFFAIAIHTKDILNQRNIKGYEEFTIFIKKGDWKTFTVLHKIPRYLLIYYKISFSYTLLCMRVMTQSNSYLGSIV